MPAKKPAPIETPAPNAVYAKSWDAILADPPWQHQGGEKHYPTMSLKDICGMGDAIRSVTKDNSWLFLWTTKTLVEDAKRVMAAWSYEYRDTIFWVKPNHFGFGNPKVGVRRATEMLLVGVRGNVKAAYRSQPDWFPAPVGRHSEKPLEQYALVERLVGAEAHVLELFARVRRVDPRYGFWGNELARCDVNFSAFGYPVPADDGAAGDD